jgi:ABC-type nitrate/sulfonate/bicarbonate transport system permease component
MLWGGTRRRPVGAAEPSRALWPWVALAAAIAMWQLVAYLQGPRTDHPTLSSLTNALLDSHPARAVAFAAWLLTAAELARR